jgi:hypothetical protein
MNMNRIRLFLLTFLLIVMTPIVAQATTKGLNQIVTPDIQPFGQISLSFQAQHPFIGNSQELQVEAGLTHNFEMAFFMGMDPNDQILNAEYGLKMSEPFLLSVGFTNWSRRGAGPFPYLESGYYKGLCKTMVGWTYANNRQEAILGFGYQTNPDLLLQLDYQSGAENFFTAGFTYNITPALSFNPALYVSNSGSHALCGYAVMTWTFTAFK